MKRKITEILIEVEETVRLRKTNQSAADKEKTFPAATKTIVCPFCGKAFSTGESLEDQSKNQNEQE